ncbi:lymphotoxin beta receptor inhibitor-like [Dermatophagoides pteronyssinus]|uniref:Multiple coagulation factor deficiency protein 2 homolog n=1 Tax=Dermatophagoides pteronyssinus TaxID=6956 RepID=A0A6P6Y291_DERPT|nr:multiple coagulation factor deficiency protein 2 homolog [Dermatophagoides pteronyssinus]
MNNYPVLMLSYTIILSIILIIKVPSIIAHYNQPQYGVPVQQQQQQVYHQQQYQQQQVPMQQQQQVVYQTPGQVPHYQQVPQAGQNVLHDDSRIHDKEHIKEHLHEALGDQDVSKMSEEELQFHYFKMHDNDNNNMLDGSELIKSLIHWHVEESRHLGKNASPHGTTKIFTDTELEQMIDPILQMDDKNNDGFIDYPEFVAAQKTRGF